MVKHMTYDEAELAFYEAKVERLRFQVTGVDPFDLPSPAQSYRSEPDSGVNLLSNGAILHGSTDSRVSWDCPRPAPAGCPFD